MSVAAIIATDVKADGRREVLGLSPGPSETREFWVKFLRGLVRCDLRGVQLVISDAHEGLKAAIAQVLNVTWQRCRVHFMRALLVCVPKAQQLQSAHTIPPAKGGVRPRHGSSLLVTVLPAGPPPILFLRTGLG